MPPLRTIHRSGLTMPINNPRFVNAAWTRGCDGFTLDRDDRVVTLLGQWADGDGRPFAAECAGEHPLDQVEVHDQEEDCPRAERTTALGAGLQISSAVGAGKSVRIVWRY